MPFLDIYVSDDAFAKLERAAKEDVMSRSPEELAEAAVEDAAIRWSNDNERNRT